MLQIRREVVYTKLDPLPYRALQSAFELARARGNAYVELAHWLNQTLMLPDSDLHRIAAAFGIDLARLTADLSRALEGHEVCARAATAATEWVQGISVDLGQIANGVGANLVQQSLHPNVAGHAQLGRCISAFVGGTAPRGTCVAGADGDSG